MRRGCCWRTCSLPLPHHDRSSFVNAPNRNHTHSMPELRKDPITGRCVTLATDRNKPPKDYRRPAEARRTDPANCPFCPGNEGETPTEIFALRSTGSGPNTPGGTVRAVPNKYPALRIEGELNREGLGVYDKMNGVGAHEVIIETPHHHEDLVDLYYDRIAA